MDSRKIQNDERDRHRVCEIRVDWVCIMIVNLDLTGFFGNSILGMNGKLSEENSGQATFWTLYWNSNLIHVLCYEGVWKLSLFALPRDITCKANG